MSQFAEFFSGISSTRFTNTILYFRNKIEKDMVSC